MSAMLSTGDGVSGKVGEGVDVRVEIAKVR
jgi:hypothetical protein